ncbi:hypothetical protein H2O04_07515 [Pseudomonas aeruginosa]|nr:hypothetical protein [Pseudomonas aeruginosa]MBA5129244.1 hypothetical protein [Pseudomonas aeruginosa]
MGVNEGAWRALKAGLVVAEGKDVAAGMALEVIEHAGIDFFTHACTGEAANCAASQATQDGTSQTAQGHSDGASDRAQGGTTLRSGCSARRAGRCSAYSTGCATDFAGMVARCDARRVTGRAVN